MNKNKDPLVSIIVPSFNVEPYIKKCLDSIKAQTYHNWECIIVDRPSTKDNTTAVIQQYIQGDDRFKFIRQSNKGVSDGRNAGFRAAKGKYIQFTDPDDWLLPELLSLSVDRAELTGAQIVQFEWRNFDVQTGRYSDTGLATAVKHFPRLFSIQTMGDEIFKYGEIYVNSMSKLWRKSFLDKVRLHYPTNLKRAEDLAEVSRLVMNASRITCLDKVLYCYKANEYSEDSLSNFISSDEHDLDFYVAIMTVHDNMAKLNLLPKLKKGFCRMAMNNSLYAMHMSRFNIMANKKIYDCIRSKIMPMISKELQSINPEMLKLFSENSYSEYLSHDIKSVYSDNQSKQNYIDHLEEENQQLQRKLNIVRANLNSFLSTKRSAKLLAGNTRRMIKHKISVIKQTMSRNIYRYITKDTNWSIITANCLGGVIYHKLGSKMLTPTINMWMDGTDFLVFVNHLHEFIDHGKFKKINEKWQDDLGFYYPIAELSTPEYKITINFNHHDNFNKAINDWNRRRSRINFNKIFILLANYEPNEQYYQQFDKLPYKHKLILTTKNIPKKYKKIAHHIEYPDTWRGDWSMQPDPQNAGHLYYERWDFKKWLNQK